MNFLRSFKWHQMFKTNKNLQSIRLFNQEAQQLTNNNNNNNSVYIETYGCQMNFSDTEIVLSILQKNGFQRVDKLADANVALLMTCAIREGAEAKIFHRLLNLHSVKRKSQKQLRIGVLGCMAERLKSQLLEDEKYGVSVVCGPDAYRDLPQLLTEAQAGRQGMSVALSLEETYADVQPVRLCSQSTSAFVSVQRGCDNMCSYCIVPWTRGRERSRPLKTIVNEVTNLVSQGVREVVLLGQNVNSYRDVGDGETIALTSSAAAAETKLSSSAFKTIYRPKRGGYRFSDLLAEVSSVHPELRVRFTSPHPKDFPDEVLQLICERQNICKQLHLPAQSGSTSVLERMNRGYSREAYLDLVEKVRGLIPGIALSSDFIAGFCGETEAEHQDTLSLMEAVKYSFVFCFPYSMREKTKAHRRLMDDIPDEVKSRRHMELASVFRRLAHERNVSQIGQVQLILVEGVSKRSADDLYGRNDANTKVIFPRVPLTTLNEFGAAADAMEKEELHRLPTIGDYVAVHIDQATSQVLRGRSLALTSLQQFHSFQQRDDFCNLSHFTKHNQQQQQQLMTN